MNEIKVSLHLYTAQILYISTYLKW